MNASSASPVMDALPLIVLAVAFLLGSVPFGILVARVFHVRDLTEKGSGNIGATNVSRVAGFWPAGFLTFLLDVLKGVLPVLLVSVPVIREWWSGLAGLPDPDFGLPMVWATGFAAVLGHCFSPWVKFKGGKGVATGFGVIAVLSPLAAAIGLVGFVLAFLNKRIGSLASLTGLGLAAIAHLVLHPIGAHLWIGALLVLLIVVRHESNINALLEDREKAF